MTFCIRFRFAAIGFAVLCCCHSSASADTPAQPVTLLSMGDWGTGGKEQKFVANALWRYAGAIRRPVSGMLLVGDNFYMKLPLGVNDPAWQSVFERMYDPVRLNFPFFAVLGNHDYKDGADAVELDYARLHPGGRWTLPGRWYRVDFPQQHPVVTALMLDSDRDALGPERWADEKAWLAAQLATPRGTWTICCAHHPLFSNGGHGDNAILQNDWGRLFVKYNVDFYLCGHDHDLQHLQIPDWFTSFLLVGGGGAGGVAMRHDDRGPMSRLAHGFASLTFAPDHADVQFILDNGRVLHQFTRTKAGVITVQRDGGHSKASPNPLAALEGFGEYHPPASQPATQPGPAFNPPPHP